MTSVLLPVVLSKKYVVAKPPTEHDVQVVNRINRCIDESYAGVLRNRGGEQLATVAFVLEKAQNQCMNSRKGPLDLVGRDAEYYLKLRWRVSENRSAFTKLFQGSWDTFANGSYNFLKLAMIGTGLEEHIRTDPEVMVSSPGGVIWGAKGSLDGFNDQGKRLGKPTPATMPASPPDFREIEMT